MDHLEVLMRLHDTPAALFSTRELRELTHVQERAFDRCVADLMASGLARMVEREGASAVQYAVRDAGDRQDVDALAVLYHQRPVSLVRLVYEQPSTSPRSLGDALGGALGVRKDDNT